MNILYPFMQFQEGYYPKKVALKQPMIYVLLQIDLSKKKKRKVLWNSCSDQMRQGGKEFQFLHHHLNPYWVNCLQWHWNQNCLKIVGEYPRERWTGEKQITEKWPSPAFPGTMKREESREASKQNGVLFSAFLQLTVLWTQHCRTRDRSHTNAQKASVLGSGVGGVAFCTGFLSKNWADTLLCKTFEKSPI